MAQVDWISVPRSAGSIRKTRPRSRHGEPRALSRSSRAATLIWRVIFEDPRWKRQCWVGHNAMDRWLFQSCLRLCGAHYSPVPLELVFDRAVRSCLQRSQHCGQPRTSQRPMSPKRHSCCMMRPSRGCGGNAHKPDRLLRRSAAWPGDAGDSNGQACALSPAARPAPFPERFPRTQRQIDSSSVGGLTPSILLGGV